FQQHKTYTVAAGVHTVTVTVSGNKNAASAGAYLIIDAFTVAAAPPPPPPPPPPVGAGTYEDSDSAVIFSGTWTSFANAANSGGSAKYSGQTGAQVSLTFDGALLTLTYLAQANAGIATVAIDGTTVDQLDTYSATALFQQHKTYTVAAGVHTVTVTVSGNKNAASAGAYLIIDAFTVAAAPPPPPPPVGAGTYQDSNSAVTFGGSWTSWSDGGNSGGSLKYSGQTGAQV